MIPHWQRPQNCDYRLTVSNLKHTLVSHSFFFFFHWNTLSSKYNFKANVWTNDVVKCLLDKVLKASRQNKYSNLKAGSHPEINSGSSTKVTEKVLL